MMSSISEDEDGPQLSAETFAVLQEFYKEQEEREHEFNAEVNRNAIFKEDWQLSQFWYDDHTVEVLINVALKATGENSKIALVSCPTLYRPLREKANTNCEITLFEYDRRFAAYGDNFIYYDYKLPLEIQRDKADYYDLVIADPPFLSEECLTKTAVTVRYLTKNKIILCTGAVMADLANRLLDLKKCCFEPKHKNNLANAFSCYANFNMDSFL